MRHPVFAALCAAICLTSAVYTQPSWASGHHKHLVRLYKAVLLEDPATHFPFSASDLNNRGEVSGAIHASAVGFDVHAAIWRRGQIIRLAETGATFQSGAHALNDVGDVVGDDEEWSVGWGALWHEGSLSMVGSMEGDFVFWPTRVNNRGEIVADSNDDGRAYFVVGEGHSWNALEAAPDGISEHAADINYRSHVVGADVGPNGARAVLWRDGTVEVLGSLAGMTNSEATGIDAFDRIVGFSSNSQTGMQRAFLWRHGAMKELPLLAKGDSTAALAINDWGQIVGREQAAGNVPSRAVLWEGGRAFDLNALIYRASTLESHIALRSAFRINEWGQILASAQNDPASGDERFYLLTPVFQWR